MKNSKIRLILKHEYDRVLEAIYVCKDELKKLPNGSSVIRNRGNNSYMYLTYRENGKIVNKYIGNINSEKAKKLENDLKTRKCLLNILNDREFEKKEIEVCLKASEKLYQHGSIRIGKPVEDISYLPALIETGEDNMVAIPDTVRKRLLALENSNDKDRDKTRDREEFRKHMRKILSDK